ncbi:hypothetical protein PGTUg99_005010 [Puccinia graminis f. sp. tritici]|nr:hypothetical protein PGTUg99_005010 [Puccinia graminis f. sp. tritici]
MPKNPPRRALPGAQGPGPQTARGDDGEGALGGPDRCRYARAMCVPLGSDRPCIGAGETARPKIPNRIRPARTSITQAEEDLEKARLGALSSKVAPPTLLLSLF